MVVSCVRIRTREMKGEITVVDSVFKVMKQSEVVSAHPSTICCCIPLIRRQPQISPTHVIRSSCKKLLICNGHPNKILLYPEEGWAHSASSSYWTLVPFWWSRNRCKIIEVAGTRRHTTKAKVEDLGAGNFYITGSFKKLSTNPDFKLSLTSNITTSDFNMGYIMTGALERGTKKTNTFEMTHFAVIRRFDCHVS